MTPDPIALALQSLRQILYNGKARVARLRHDAHQALTQAEELAEVMASLEAAYDKAARDLEVARG